MGLVLALISFALAFLFLITQGEVMAYRESKGCKKKTLLISNNVVEFYECPAIDYYSYKTVMGKRLLFKGNYNNMFAYYHELGHLIYDNFLLDTLIVPTIVLPVFLLNSPWDMLVVVLIYIMLKWHKKMEERRADIFAHEMTGLRYISSEVEKSKLQLLFHWLFWSHPPEIVRKSKEYYKKEVTLFRLFLDSILG